MTSALSVASGRNVRNWQVMGESFELESPRYKVVDYLGSGAYGVKSAHRNYNLSFHTQHYY